MADADTFSLYSVTKTPISSIMSQREEFHIMNDQIFSPFTGFVGTSSSTD